MCGSTGQPRTKKIRKRLELEKPMFLSVVIFGSNRNDGVLVQLSETSSALSVDAVHSTTCLAR